MIKRVLPWLVGLLCLAQLVASSAAAVDLRADQRRAAAAAKEKREVAAFRVAITPIALRLFDVVQPLHDVIDDPDVAETYYPFMRDDVLDKTGVVADVAALQSRLAKVTGPLSRRASKAALQKGMAQLVAATKSLAAATHARGDRAGYVKAFGSGFDALEDASAVWTGAITDEFGPGKIAAPSSHRVTDAGRKVATRGGYVRLADRACGVAYTAHIALPDHSDFVTRVRLDLPREAVIGERMDKALRSIAVPRDPAATRLRGLLGAVTRFNARERALIAAARAGDQASFQAAARALLAGLPAMRDLSHAFDEYGATLCAHFLDVSDVLSGDGAKPDLPA